MNRVGHVDAFVGEDELADGGGSVWCRCRCRGVVADVVAGPAAADFVAAGGRLTDEVVQAPVVAFAVGARTTA